MDLSKNEKQFLIGCIIMSSYEGFYGNAIPITDEEIKDLMVLLGATEEDLDKFYRA